LQNQGRVMSGKLAQQPKETFDVFLCHNAADKDWVHKLAEQIESETFDGRANGRPLRVFFDEWDIDVGQNVLLRINRGLTASRYVAIIISPEMLASPWAGLEWTHVVADDPTNRKGRIVPLFLRDYSEALKQNAELPAPFKALNWIDFRRLAEFKHSCLKLIRKIRDEVPTRGRKRRPLASVQDEVTPVLAPSEDTSSSPDRVPDVLLGNLLPVFDYPKTVWFAPTDAQSPRRSSFCRKSRYSHLQTCPDQTRRCGRRSTIPRLTLCQSQPGGKILCDGAGLWTS